MGKPKIVFTSGSWDLFHIGHLNILERSKALGDKLIVGVSTDELIEEYKGMTPVIPFEERARIVGSIKCVDKVVKQTVLTEIRQLQEFQIEIVTIGDDWKDKYLAGLEWIKSQPGKEVVYFDYTLGVSTSSIKKKIIQHAHETIVAELEREEAHMEEWKNKRINFK